MAKTIEDLANGYGYFENPHLCVKIEGEDILKDDEIIIENASVVVSTGIESSVFTLSISGKNTYYSHKQKKFITDPKLKKVNKLGAKIEVYMGYNNAKNSKRVFVGYIYTINSKIIGESEDVGYEIEALDTKAFMMNNTRSDIKKDVKKYSDAVSGVLKDYSAFYEEVKVDQTDELTVPISQYNQSDYDFVVDLARKLNYLFYVFDGKVNFIKYSTNKEVTAVISPGKYLRDFNREITLSEQIKSVKVRNNNEQNPEEPIEGVATTVESIGKGSKTATDLTKTINDKMEKVIIDTSVKSPAEAKIRAEAELTRLSLNFAKGSFKVIGIPDIEPGKYVKIKGIDEDMDEEYFITEVKHEIKNYEYETYCKFEVNKI